MWFGSRAQAARRLPEWRSEVEKAMKSPSKRLCLMGLTLGVGLTFSAGGLRAQTQTPNLQTAVEGAQTPQDQKIQQLQDKLEEIQTELMELKQANSAQPTTHFTATAKPPPPPSALTQKEPKNTDPSNPKPEPFTFA